MAFLIVPTIRSPFPLLVGAYCSTIFHSIPLSFVNACTFNAVKRRALSDKIYPEDRNVYKISSLTKDSTTSKVSLVVTLTIDQPFRCFTAIKRYRCPSISSGNGPAKSIENVSKSSVSWSFRVVRYFGIGSAFWQLVQRLTSDETLNPTEGHQNRLLTIFHRVSVSQWLIWLRNNSRIGFLLRISTTLLEPVAVFF